MVVVVELSSPSCQHCATEQRRSGAGFWHFGRPPPRCSRRSGRRIRAPAATERVWDRLIFDDCPAAGLLQRQACPMSGGRSTMTTAARRSRMPCPDSGCGRVLCTSVCRSRRAFRECALEDSADEVTPSSVPHPSRADCHYSSEQRMEWHRNRVPKLSRTQSGATVPEAVGRHLCGFPDRGSESQQSLSLVCV
jgi:hypothetical protein